MVGFTAETQTGFGSLERGVPLSGALQIYLGDLEDGWKRFDILFGLCVLEGVFHR